MISRPDGCGLVILFLFAVNFSPVQSLTAEESANISLRLYTGKTVDQYSDAFIGDAVSLMKNMDLEKPTVLYIHGFSENLDRDSVKTVVGAYLKRQDHNVLAADYSEIAGRNYIYAASSVAGVGKVLAEALNDMVANSLHPKRLHVVGHSLGGQVAGYIGRSVDFKLPRITGLDPAGPGFYRIISHLSSGDAEFVDVIHADAGVYGINVESGTADFYPNSGKRVQPGCPKSYRIGDDQDFCSHHRSWRFYAESVTNEKAFVAVECPDGYKFRAKKCKNNKKVVMGFATPIGTKGTFYLDTNTESPFGRGEDGVNPIARSISRR